MFPLEAERVNKGSAAACNFCSPAVSLGLRGCHAFCTHRSMQLSFILGSPSPGKSPWELLPQFGKQHRYAHNRAAPLRCTAQFLPAHYKSSRQPLVHSAEVAPALPDVSAPGLSPSLSSLAARVVAERTYPVSGHLRMLKAP